MPQLEAKPERQSQITEQIENLERGLPQIHGAIDDLAAKLTSVLRQPSTAKESIAKDRPELVVLACTLQGFRDYVKLAREKIDDLLDRLEV